MLLSNDHVMKAWLGRVLNEAFRCRWGHLKFPVIRSCVTIRPVCENRRLRWHLQSLGCLSSWIQLVLFCDRATSLFQVVSGYKYVITVKLGRTPCRKGSAQEECAIHQDPQMARVITLFRVYTLSFSGTNNIHTVILALFEPSVSVCRCFRKTIDHDTKSQIFNARCYFINDNIYKNVYSDVCFFSSSALPVQIYCVEPTMVGWAQTDEGRMLEGELLSKSSLFTPFAK